MTDETGKLIAYAIFALAAATMAAPHIPHAEQRLSIRGGVDFPVAMLVELSGDVSTTVSGSLDTSVSGSLDTSVSGSLDTDVSGSPRNPLYIEGPRER